MDAGVGHFEAVAVQQHNNLRQAETGRSCYLHMQAVTQSQAFPETSVYQDCKPPRTQGRMKSQLWISEGSR